VLNLYRDIREILKILCDDIFELFPAIWIGGGGCQDLGERVEDGDEERRFERRLA
jgi:hypothetical protein